MTRALAPILLLSVAALVTPQPPATAGDPPTGDLAAGLLETPSDARAAAAERVGAADLVTAAPAIPVLVEALDDEAAPVRAAARGAILALANRAAPSILRDLSEASIADGPDDVASLVLMLGPALTPSDLAHALSSGAKDLRVDWIATALFGADNLDQEWSTKSQLRMSAIEAGRRSGPEKAQAAAATALLAFRVVRSRAQVAGDATPALAAPGAEKALAAILAAKGSRSRAEFAAQFVTVTGIGDASTVEGLKALLASAPPEATPASDALPGEGSSRQAAGALGRLSASVPAARAAIEALDDATFGRLGVAIARGGAASIVAARAAAGPPAERAIRAANAVLDGDARDPALVPVLAAALDEPSLSSPGRLAANALGRLGAAAAPAVPALEAALGVKNLSRADRVALGGALVRIHPGHEAGQAALLAEATGKAGPPNPRAGSAEVKAHDMAIEALADGGTGEAVEAVLVSALQPITPAAEGSLLAAVGRATSAARGLGRLGRPSAAAGAAPLVALLTSRLPGDEGDESAAGLEKSGAESAAPYRLRAAALDGLSGLQALSAEQRETVRSLLSSPDPRIRYRAALTRRHLLITDK